ncbi:MAG TPA: acVLRF1 family peptidyl-tRNA hydrolase [Pseudonocardiaceae bacterium]|nr:acVLRF1 family peptidyl-tRNA hydrolase [Pseudonocardiaceae bacterium]
MSRIRELAAGGRAVEVAPERLARFLERFAAGHGGVVSTTVCSWQADLVADDGWTASIPVPFSALESQPGTHAGLVMDDLIAHLMLPRTVGLLLVRLGGYSVGIARAGVVLTSSTGSRLVHGRSAAGGRSQQRFARRREGQARLALRAAADTAARVLLPRTAELDAVVLGGDAAALRSLAADPRLTALLEQAESRVLDIPEPRRAVLDDVAQRARCVEVQLHPPG